MKNFIKTWAYRFDATLGPCLIVYAVMALLNAQCIYQTKLSDHPGMGAWFAAKHLDFVFLGAFIAIIVIHVMYLQRYYLYRPVQRRLMILPQSRFILYLSELLTIFFTFLGLAVIQGTFWLVALNYFYGTQTINLVLASVYESALMQMLFANGFTTFFVYLSFLELAGFILLIICGNSRLFSLLPRLAIVLIIATCFVYLNFIDEKFYIFVPNLVLAAVMLRSSYDLYMHNKAGV